MVGGTVIGISRSKENTLLNVEDGRDLCAVRCIEQRKDNSEPVNITTGDCVWWQGGSVLWTPVNSPRERCGKDFDIHLPKVGYSH